MVFDLSGVTNSGPETKSSQLVVNQFANTPLDISWMGGYNLHAFAGVAKR